MSQTIDLTKILTETRNENTMNIDSVSTLEMLQKINDEDKKIALAVEKALPAIATAVDKIAASFMQGGRLIYLGAGTSGRLGILDASECPPTYGVSAEMVQGIIAGGDTAIRTAVEGAEDSTTLAEKNLKEISLQSKDVVVGLAASGRTPYVIGALQYAKSIGCVAVAVVCSNNSELSNIADISIELLTGAEVIMGSTRMKAGTAQKMVLNMLSTGAMIKTGKVFGNLMIDVQATNKKLVERAKRIVMQATGVEKTVAEDYLDKANGSVKLATTMIITNSSATEAQKLLEKADGFVAKAVEINKKSNA